MKYLLRTTLLSLLFCAALLSTSALAAGETYLWYDSGTSKIYSCTNESDVNNTSDSTELTEDSGYYPLNGATATTYKLMSDVTIDKPILVTDTVTLDLNGYVLKYENSSVKGSVIRVGTSSYSSSTLTTNPGFLTLTDSNTSAPTHYFTEDATTHLWSYYGTTPPVSGDHETVSGGIITGGTGSSGSIVRGGGVFVDTGSSFTMNGGHIVGCTAADGGGGVSVRGDPFTIAPNLPTPTTFTMSGGSIRGCTATGNGGGVFLDNPGAQFEMLSDNDPLIASCTTSSNGGGVGVSSNTTFTMSGGTIKDCTAKGSDTSSKGLGGGVFVSGTFTMSGGTIKDCTANNSSSGNGGKGGGVYVNSSGSSNCTLQSGTISNCTATGDSGGKGGGVFVDVDKTLTVGGGSTTLTITDNTSGTTSTTDDNICLGSAATITVRPLASGSTPSLPITYTPTNLNLTSLDAGDLTTKGYAWDSGNKKLTLRNVTLGNITLPSEDTTIIIDGNVTVNSIGDASFAKALTIEGSTSTPADSKLTVNERITCTTNANLLTLKNITATVGCINWTHNVGAQGLKLENSLLTVNGINESGTMVGIIAGQITLDDDASSITLRNGYISGNGDTALNTVPSYCPCNGSYSIGNPGGDATYYLLNGGSIVNSVTLLKNPPASTPPSSSDDGPTYYRITVSEPVNGAVEANRKTATSGTTITVTVSPASGYDLETLTVLDRRDREVKLTALGDGKYTFKMPSSNVTVSAHFTLLPDFDDVDPEDYFYDALRWAVNNDVTDGIGGGKFGPDLTCTRAQIVTFLWRTSGRPIAARTEMPFSDVAPESYYHDAVLWAIETGVTTGTSATTFSPDLTCTREQAVAFLYRYARYNGIDVSAGEDTNILSYTDATSVADYAFPAFQWAVGAGVVRGADAKLMPADPCTRAQIITMLYRTMNP